MSVSISVYFSCIWMIRPASPTHNCCPEKQKIRGLQKNIIERSPSQASLQISSFER